MYSRPKSAVTVRTRTKLGGRAFSVSGLTAWNNLPSELQAIDSRYPYPHIRFKKTLTDGWSWSPICFNELLTLLITVIMHHCLSTLCIKGTLIQIFIIVIYLYRERSELVGAFFRQSQRCQSSSWQHWTRRAVSRHHSPAMSVSLCSSLFVSVCFCLSSWPSST